MRYRKGREACRGMWWQGEEMVRMRNLAPEVWDARRGRKRARARGFGGCAERVS